MIKRSEHTVYEQAGGSGERTPVSYSSIRINKAGLGESRKLAKEMKFVWGYTSDKKFVNCQNFPRDFGDDVLHLSS